MTSATGLRKHLGASGPLGEVVPAFVVVALAPAAFLTGTVKWFSNDKAYALITADQAGKDLFVHHSAIAGSGFRSLAEGAKVSYDAQQGQKGPAANVQLI